MLTVDLGGPWTMRSSDSTQCDGAIPGSAYSFLLANGLMEDPYYRTNELGALALMDADYTFTRTFTADAGLLACPRVLLRCEGLDTLCDVHVNGVPVGSADNMHRTWEFDVKDMLREGENTLDVLCHSPTRWVAEAYEKDPIGASYHAMKGFPHLRKAHCMFGWDWGPRLPDCGIWRPITLLGLDTSRIEDLHIRQRHQDGGVDLHIALAQSGNAEVKLALTAPDGAETALPDDGHLRVEHPQLWWPRGMGTQPLYTLTATLLENGQPVDTWTRRIGLRTLDVLREPDQWGESFAQRANGIAFFAMGADYIPEDNILSRVTPERTQTLLEQCAAANFNAIRVWGGGYYPDDWFFDICDELGLVVWQDFMFACANYRLTEAFEENIRQEFRDNIRRLRHHASLGLWCGNNEMEDFQTTTVFDSNHKTRSNYIRMFEHILPKMLRQYDPDTFYWPASPSSGGGFDEPNAPNRGDVHYWAVWHGGLPFTAYREFLFRYASEFGFQSFPAMKTIESFTLPEDRNIFSRTMEMHQRNEGANGKIMLYLSQTFLYPTSLEALVYASQQLQAQAIRYGVEHWRRNRGACMGAIYWQLNDIWPVASWASIDYFGRWKALHYYAKRFFAPVMISCEEIGETSDRISVVMQPSPIEISGRLSVANESPRDISGEVRWALRDHTGKALRQGSQPLTVPAFSAVWMEKIAFEGADFLTQYMSYAFIVDGETVSAGTVLFTAPKHFSFLPPNLRCTLEGDTVTIEADAYARDVEIYSPEDDIVLSDNYFDIHGGSAQVKLLHGDPKTLKARSVYDIR